MKKNKIIAIGSMFVFVIALSFTYFTQNRVEKLTQEKISNAFKYGLEEILGHNVNIGSVKYFEKERKVIVSNITLSLKSSSQDIISISKLEGMLKRNESNSLEFEKMNLSGLKLLFLKDEDSSLGSEDVVNRFFDYKKIKELSYNSFDKNLETKIEALKNQLLNYKLSTNEKKICSNPKNLNCLKAQDRLVKIQERIATSIKDNQFVKIKNIIEKNEKFIKKRSINSEEIIKAVISKEQLRTTNIVKNVLKSVYKAQFNFVEKRQLAHDLVINEIHIKEKINNKTNKVLVGKIEKLTTQKSNMKLKTVFRIQGDFDKYQLKGVNLRLVIHRGKEKAVSLQMKANDFKMKSFVFNGQSKGSINRKFSDLEKYTSKSSLFSNIKNKELVVNSNYEDTSKYLDLNVKIRESLSSQVVESFKKNAIKYIEIQVNKNEELLGNYRSFFNDYNKRFIEANSELSSILPSYKTIHLTLGNQ